VPTGQFDPARLINPGANPWAFKPEAGLAADSANGRWISTVGSGCLLRTRSSIPAQACANRIIGSLEFQFGYYFRPKLWTSFDCNFWSDGSTVLNGVSNHDGARNSRIGGTAAVPLTQHTSIKFTANRGAIVRVGGNFTTAMAAWQYSWFTKPK
jgi:Putative MetA-pathway of phenol degradation